MSSSIKTNSGWRGETSLDIEWIHAIAPNAKILLVEATTPSGTNLINAVDYATSRNDVVAVSMSWGGAEFPEEVSMDSHFVEQVRRDIFCIIRRQWRGRFMARFFTECHWCWWNDNKFYFGWKFSKRNRVERLGRGSQCV